MGHARPLRVLNVSLRSTAGGREYSARGKGLDGDSESRRPDWQKALHMEGFRASGHFPESPALA